MDSQWVNEFCRSSNWNDVQFDDLSLTGSTPCFEDIVLRGTVHLCFLVMLTIRLITVARHPKLPGYIRTVPASLFYTRLVACIIYTVMPALYISGMLSSEAYAPYELITEPLTVVVWVYCTIVMSLEYRRFRRKGRWMMPFLWLLALAADGVRFRSMYLLSMAEHRLYFFIVYCIGLAALIVLVVFGVFIRPSNLRMLRKVQQYYYLHPETPHSAYKVTGYRFLGEGNDRVETDLSTPPKEETHPEVRANVCSFFTFGWLTPLMRKGYKRPLMLDDISTYPERMQAQAHAQRFKTAWESLRLKGKRVSLLKAFHKAFGRSFYLAGVWLLVQNAMQYVPSILLRYLIRLISEKDEGPAWLVYALAVGMFAILVVASMVDNQYFHRSNTIGSYAKAALVSAIYRKSLRLSNKEFQARSTGAITNHMATDTDKIQQQATQVHNLWSAPLRILLGTILLYDGLGVSALVGVGVLGILTPLQIRVMHRQAKLMKTNFLVADRRIKLMNEILPGMKVIKQYTWEPSFEKRVLDIRSEELSWLKKFAYTSGLTMTLVRLNPVLLSVGGFAAFAAIEGNLTAEKAFFALSIFQLLYWPIMLLPRALAGVMQALVSVRRIEDFLNAEELSNTERSVFTGSGPSGTTPFHPPNSGIAKGEVQVVDGWFSWESSATALRRVNLSVKPGELVAIIGKTGSGKSTFLSSLLGETVAVRGSVQVEGRVSYVPQQAWIFNATVKENILFQQEFDEERYWKTVEVCCLEDDFLQFDAADAIELGEKGVNLSGGQKQRLSLARAVYANADVVILDDCISALDSKVGAKIFHNCVKGYLKDKTRIMVTNQLHFLPNVDRIILLEEGEVAGMGSYEELMETNTKFASMVADLESAEAEEVIPMEQFGEPGLKTFMSRRQFASLALGHAKAEEEEGVPLSWSTLSVTQETLTSNTVAETKEPENKPKRPRNPNLPPTGLKGGSKKKIQGQRVVWHEDSGLESSAAPESKQTAPQFSTLDMSSLRGNAWAKKGPTGGAIAGTAKRALIQAKLIQAMAKFKNKKAELDFGRLTKAEERATGGIRFSVYKRYAKAAGGWPFFLGLVLCHLLGEAAKVGSSFWLTAWTNNSYEQTVNFYMAIFFGFSVLQTFLFGGATVAGAQGSVRASRHLHESMLRRVFRTTMGWLASTPEGRVINRFTKDVSQTDNVLMHHVQLFFESGTTILGTLVTISIVSPWSIVTFVPILTALYFVQRFFRSTSRELKRLDAVTRSPIYAGFSETLDGMSTIRAFQAAQHVEAKTMQHVDRNLSVYLMLEASSRWLSIRLEFLGGLMILAASLFAVIAREQLGGDMVGLSLSYALSITLSFNSFVRMSAKAENSFNSVERIEEYTKIEQEDAWVKPQRPPPGWPSAGNIAIKDLELKYHRDSDSVMQDLNVVFKPREKIGIVGRTGAGKSTLFQALFRIMEAFKGGIEVDGENIAQYGLHDVRRAISIIPQDPILFSGTVRSNLDPLEEHDDASLWEALERAQLSHLVNSHPFKLNMAVAQSGSNFSVGQRQLMCLARAILRGSPILLVDEATANVDLETDALIQQTIREEFKNCTTLTIAHRLNTIIDSDRILVLGQGKLLEFDTPAALLANQKSEFSSMVNETGASNASFLRRVAAGETSLAEVFTLAAPSKDLSRTLGPLQQKVEDALNTLFRVVDHGQHAELLNELERNGQSEELWLEYLDQSIDKLQDRCKGLLRKRLGMRRTVSNGVEDNTTGHNNMP